MLTDIQGMVKWLIWGRTYLKGVEKEFIGKVDPDLRVLRMSEFDLVFHLLI